MTTDNHPFYVQGKGFIKAEGLFAGDKLISVDGKDLIVETHDIEQCENPVTVYNFKVEDYHTYFVGESGVWVHNADCPNDNLKVGSEDITNTREKYGLSDTNTVAVGKTDVPGLENMTFEGGSPKVRNELGLPDLDSEMPNRSIKAPSDNPLFNRHAEEVIANKFDNAVKNAGLSADEVDGTLRIHQSNPSGVCKKCIQGLSNDNVKPGVLKQLSKKYPKLVIKITSELDSNVKVTGRAEVVIKNGGYLK